MTIWRPAASASRARSIIPAIAPPFARRSTGTCSAFQRYQPKNGIHISSRLTMKAGSSNSVSSVNASQND